MTTDMLLYAVVLLMHMLRINGRSILERSELNKSDLQAVNQLDMNSVTNPTDSFRSLSKLLQKETKSTLPVERTDQTATIPDNFRSLSKLLQKESKSTLPVEKTYQTATIPIQPEPHHVLLKDILNTMDKLVNLKAQQEPSSVIGSSNGEIFLLNFDVVSNPELLLDINLKPNLKNILIKDILLRDDLGKCITL